MKLRKLTHLASLVFLATASLGQAALVAQFNTSNIIDASTPWEPVDWADNTTTPTDLGPAAGSSVTRTSSSTPVYTSLPTTIDLLQYVGFSQSAEAGYELTITDMTFQTGSVFSGSAPTRYPTTAYVWGYRVDNGTGFGDWVLGDTSVRGDSDFTDRTTIKSWDMEDFSTTGTVEFGLFAAGDPYTGAGAPNPNYDARVEVRSVTVNGTVAAVPEPSTAILGALGSLALLRRRR